MTNERMMVLFEYLCVATAVCLIFFVVESFHINEEMSGKKGKGKGASADGDSGEASGGSSKGGTSVKVNRC